MGSWASVQVDVDEQGRKRGQERVADADTGRLAGQWTETVAEGRGGECEDPQWSSQGPRACSIGGASDGAIKAGGTASIRIARPAALVQEREPATRMAEARAAEYRAVIDQAGGSKSGQCATL